MPFSPTRVVSGVLTVWKELVSRKQYLLLTIPRTSTAWRCNYLLLPARFMSSNTEWKTTTCCFLLDLRRKNRKGSSYWLLPARCTSMKSSGEQLLGCFLFDVSRRNTNALTCCFPLDVGRKNKWETSTCCFPIDVCQGAV